MINLSLLHPSQLVAVQNWSFESESLIRIGRASDNNVIIYSAVVSRHHAELWKDDFGWIIINFGANGTYIDDEPIIQTSVVNGTIIRLGNSGPKLKVFTGELAPNFFRKKKNLFSEELPLISKSNLPEIRGKTYGYSQDITKTEFD